MTKENSPTESFFDEVFKQDMAFEEDTEETPEEENTAGDSSSQSEETDNPSQEGEQEGAQASNTPDDTENLPFHKHPRWQEVMRQRDEKAKEAEEERKTREELEQRIEKLEQGLQQDDTSQDEMPQWFAEVAGTDEAAQKAWDAYQKYSQSEKERIKQEIIEEQKQQQEKERAEQEKWDQWINEQIEAMQNDGYSFDRNELLNTAIKYRPEDDDGNISLQKAYDILQMEKASKSQEKTQQKKEVASKSDTNNKGSETTSKPSQKDISNKDWNTLINSYIN